MRVFFDTNVLASAFGTRGLCADVLGVVLSDHIFLTGECNLVELRRVLIAKFKVPNSTADDIDSFLRGYEIVPIPVVAPPASARDPDDDVVLASAIAGNADVLVTGDADLLELSGHFPFPILDPRGFWSMLRGKGAK